LDEDFQSGRLVNEGDGTNNNIIPLQTGSLSTASVRHTLSDFMVNGLYVTGGFGW
jgi:hypothetical protein